MGLRTYRIGVVLAGMAAVLAWGTVCAGDLIQVPVAETKVAPLPIGPAIEGPLPRSVLMVKLQERGEHPGDRTVSSFWIFDPASPGKGLHKFFSGPGSDQDLRFMTPLFGGYGLASGRLDPDKEPGREGPWFWFNPLEGKTGPSIDVDMWEQWIDGGVFVGERAVEGGSMKRIVRCDPLKAIVRTTELDFSYIKWTAKTQVLGVAKLKEGERVLRLDVGKSEYEIIGMPPPYSNPAANRMYGFEISPAGKNCRDGIYAVDGFSLWYLPSGGEWHPVIRDVHVVKTFGGKSPWLPVSYVGSGRFAVAKTVKDEVSVPKGTPRNESLFGAAEAVTMLIDGVTGEVLKHSKPVIYNHNPQPEVPDDWWEAGLKPETSKPEVAAASVFKCNAKRSEIRFAGDHSVKLGEDDEHAESDDGSHLVIYQKCPRGGGKARTKVPFRILDGKNGKIHNVEVESDFREVWVEVSWLVLCAASPDPVTRRQFGESGASP